MKCPVLCNLSHEPPLILSLHLQHSNISTNHEMPPIVYLISRAATDIKFAYAA